MAEASVPFRSGFVAVVGRPNVGKSTLVNALVGHKVAITSDKPQTTRHTIRGVLSRPEAQIVFVDTPGIHKPLHRLGSYMVQTALATLEDVDAVLFVVDGTSPPGAGDRYVAERLAHLSRPVVVAVNKMDLLTPSQVESAISAYSTLCPVAGALAVSAQTGRHLEELVQMLIRLLPEGPPYYPLDTVTDRPEEFLVAELIREKVLHLTREEVPHAVAVVVERMARREGRDLIDISATIYVERESQRGILIGKGGRMLREIGRLAREEIEAWLGSKVYLELWVKVSEDWREREGRLHSLGYRPEA